MFSGGTWTQLGESFTWWIDNLIFDNHIPYVIKNDKRDRTSSLMMFSSEWEWASTYQRYRNKNIIPGATKISYLLTDDDAGTTLDFVVTPVSNSWITWLAVRSPWLSIPKKDSQKLPWGGWGGWWITRDFCISTDCSYSYYDETCGVCPMKPTTNIFEKFMKDIHWAPTLQWNIAGSRYSNELNMAYVRAYQFGITTMPTIQQANIEGNLIRSHMAKMMVEFATLFDKEINTWANCSFTDMSKQSDEMKYYATVACQLWLMGLDDNGDPAKEFNPTDTVTRAQFGTVLSRLLYGNLNNAQKGTQWYTQHLQALKNAGIMKKIDNPSMKELRWYVMLMMMRAGK